MIIFITEEEGSTKRYKHYVAPNKDLDYILVYF